MDNDAIRGYLKLLMVSVEDIVNGAEIIETEDGPVLLCSMKSPFSERAEIGYQFEIEPVRDGIFILEVIIFLFSDVDKERFDGVNKLITVLNSGFDIGAFRIFEEGNSVMFTQGMILDEELDASLVTDTLGKTVSLMENTVIEKGKYINRYLNGEDLETLVGEAREAEL